MQTQIINKNKKKKKHYKKIQQAAILHFSAAILSLCAKIHSLFGLMRGKLIRPTPWHLRHCPLRLACSSIAFVVAIVYATHYIGFLMWLASIVHYIAVICHHIGSHGQPYCCSLIGYLRLSKTPQHISIALRTVFAVSNSSAIFVYFTTLFFRIIKFFSLFFLIYPFLFKCL